MSEEILVYTKNGCPYCKALIEEYNEKQISFKEIDVTKDRDALVYVKNILNAEKVPVVVKGGILDSIGHHGQG